MSPLGFQKQNNKLILTHFIRFSFFCLFCLGNLAGHPISLELSVPDSLLTNAHEIKIQEDIKFEVHSARTATYQYHLIAKILSPESNIHHVIIPYNSYSKSKWISGAIYDSNGTLVRKIKNKELTDVAYRDGISVFNDVRYYEVEMTHNRYPYTVEYTYETNYSSIRYYPNWRIQKFHQYVKKGSYLLIIPEAMDIESKEINIDSKPKLKNTANQKIYEWTVQDLPVIQFEKMSGHSSNHLPQILIAPHQIEGKNWSGSLKDWNSFGQFLNTLNEGRDKLSSPLEMKVKNLTAAATSDLEKIEILYDYLKDQTRYVSVQIGIGGWQTFAAEYVEQNKYGDCKALSNYMKAMLKVVDIPSNLVVIASGKDLALDSTFVDPSFNHMILHIPSEEMFLECTSHSFPAGYVGWSNANRKALSITDQGGKILQMPVMGSAENKLERQDTLLWDQDGQIRMKGGLVARHAQHETLRYQIKNQSEIERHKSFLENFEGSVHEVNKLTQSLVANQPEATQSYDVTLTKIGTKAGERLFIPAVPLESFQNPLSKNELRKLKTVRKYTYSDETSFVIQIPTNYEIESLPQGEIIESTEFGRYQIEYIIEQKAITVKRTLVIKPITLEAKAYLKLYAWYRSIEKSDLQKIVLKRHE